MSAVIIFDTDSETTRNQIKVALRTEGYHSTWTSGGSTYYLPSSTIWKKDSDVKTAYSDVQRVASQLGISLIRCIVLQSTPWNGIAGSP